MPGEMDYNKEHADAPQDQSQIEDNLSKFTQELLPVLEYLCQKIAYLEDRVDNQLIGGLSQHYAAQEKKGKIDELRGKYGEKMNPLISSLAGATGEGEDGFWEALHNKMKDLAIGDEDEGSFMDHMQGHLSGKRDEMIKALQGSAPEGPGQPAAVIKMETSGEPEAVAQGAKIAAQEVSKVAEKAPKEEKKESEPAVGSPEYFQSTRQGRKSSPKARK